MAPSPCKTAENITITHSVAQIVTLWLLNTSRSRAAGCDHFLLEDVIGKIRFLTTLHQPMFLLSSLLLFHTCPCGSCFTPIPSALIHHYLQLFSSHEPKRKILHCTMAARQHRVRSTEQPEQGAHWAYGVTTVPRDNPHWVLLFPALLPPSG